MGRKSIDQSQESGSNSVNIIAGGNLVLPTITYEQAKEIALNVFRENVIKLSDLAESIARSRAEKITEEFLQNLHARHPDFVKNLGDPDLQMALFDAQKAYARSGVDSLRQILVDLLTQRALKESQDLEVLVLNEAILSASKLTEGQRKTIAIVFILKYTSTEAVGSAANYFGDFLPKYLYPLIENASTKKIDFQHIEYVSAGAVSISASHLGSCLAASLEGIFTSGFDESEISAELRSAAKGKDVFIPCLRDASKLQLNNLANSKVEFFANEKALDAFRAEIVKLSGMGLLTPEQVLSEFVESNPLARSLSEIYNGSDMKNLSLTSTGIALGNAYWRMATKTEASLSIWL